MKLGAAHTCTSFRNTDAAAKCGKLCAKSPGRAHKKFSRNQSGARAQARSRTAATHRASSKSNRTRGQVAVTPIV